jgi:hypothetical protein
MNRTRKNACWYRSRHWWLAFLVLACLSGFVSAQAPPTVGAPPVAVVTFTLDFPESTPSHYSIAVEETAHASYESTVKVEDAGEETYRSTFEVSSSTRERIFEWAKQAKFFEKKIDSGNHKIAFTGQKILSYQNGQQSSTAQYNYSNLEPVRQLTALFQNMAATLDYGRKLSYLHRYQKLALDEQLREMETQARNNQLGEIQALTPVLQEIVDDPSVINGVRARARDLIQMSNRTVPGR